MNRALQVLAVSGLVTVQDHGRRGYASMGIGVSGAVDLGSHDRANRLVGNAAHAATLELTFGTIRVLATTPAWIAVTGAPAPVTAAGRRHPINSRFGLRAGEILDVGVAKSGLRTYVAVRGGIGTPPVLGSRSTDTLAGLGPEPVASRTQLPIGSDYDDFPEIDFIATRSIPSDDVLRLRATLGPRDDWFAPSAVTLLDAATWTVTPSSNRIGVRLDGPALERRVTQELPSEGVTVGAVQVTPAGPIVFLDDHPVTGGYPVIGVVDRASVDGLAQARAGQRVHFDLVPLTAPHRPSNRKD
ncbi:MAG: biotin-dependent carboxyltransferase family protein [Nocardioidaceae bacterium]